jgi:hypothetical protein
VDGVGQGGLCVVKSGGKVCVREYGVVREMWLCGRLPCEQRCRSHIGVWMRMVLGGGWGGQAMGKCVGQGVGVGRTGIFGPCCVLNSSGTYRCLFQFLFRMSNWAVTVIDAVASTTALTGPQFLTALPRGKNVVSQRVCLSILAAWVGGWVAAQVPEITMI